MSTPPTGEDPQWRPAPDAPPAPPQPEEQHGQPQPAQPEGAPSWGPPTGPASGPQPGYGPYGPPPPAGWPATTAKPPRDRRRTLLIAALVVVALLIAAGVALLVYVLSSTRLDRAAVEEAVSSQFEQRNGVALDLQCRRRMIVRVGADYECEGTTADGEEVEIRIVITSAEGAYTWAED